MRAAPLEQGPDFAGGLLRAGPRFAPKNSRGAGKPAKTARLPAIRPFGPRSNRSRKLRPGPSLCPPHPPAIPTHSPTRPGPAPLCLCLFPRPPGAFAPRAALRGFSSRRPRVCPCTWPPRQRRCRRKRRGGSSRAVVRVTGCPLTPPSPARSVRLPTLRGGWVGWRGGERFSLRALLSGVFFFRPLRPAFPSGYCLESIYEFICYEFISGNL